MDENNALVDYGMLVGTYGEMGFVSNALLGTNDVGALDSFLSEERDGDKMRFGSGDVFGGGRLQREGLWDIRHWV